MSEGNVYEAASEISSEMRRCYAELEAIGTTLEQISHVLTCWPHGPEVAGQTRRERAALGLFVDLVLNEARKGAPNLLGRDQDVRALADRAWQLGAVFDALDPLGWAAPSQARPAPTDTGPIDLSADALPDEGNGD
jgi:hypothetical protein